MIVEFLDLLRAANKDRENSGGLCGVLVVIAAVGAVYLVFRVLAGP